MLLLQAACLTFTWDKARSRVLVSNINILFWFLDVHTVAIYHLTSVRNTHYLVEAAKSYFSHELFYLGKYIAF